MSKLAVTGITGKSGLFFWKHLTENAETIKKMFPDGISLISRTDNHFSQIKKENIFFNINYFTGDLNNFPLLQLFCVGCDTLLHIAGIHWSVNLVEIAVSSGVKRLILVHTTGVYSKYKSAGEEYRQIDAQIYQLCKDNNIALTILRPTMIYGDISDENVIVFIKMIDKFKVMPTVNGAHYELQPVHCSDLGKAYHDVLLNPNICSNKDYILSGGAPLELRDMFEEIAKNLGVKRTYLSCPYWIAYTGAWITFILSLTRFDYREKVQRLVESRVYSHEEATKDFGYAPKTFKEGIVGEVIQYKASKI